MISASDVRGDSEMFSPANLLDEDYDSYWAVDDGIMTPYVTLEFDSPRTFNRVMLQEYIPLGQRVYSFTVEAMSEDGQWTEIARETTIGYKRIVLVPQTTAVALRVNITGSLACPVLNRLALYQDNISGLGPEGPVAGKDCFIPEEYIVPVSEAKVLDLGEVREADGFFYTPADLGQGGCVITYNLEVSLDGNDWTAVFKDRMFDNIVNNPVRQDVRFTSPVKMRYMRMTPVRTSDPDTYGISGFGILTDGSL